MKQVRTKPALAWILTLSAALLVATAACGGDIPAEPTATSQPTPTATPQPTPTAAKLTPTPTTAAPPTLTATATAVPPTSTPEARPTPPDIPIIDAVASGNIEAVKGHVEAGTDINGVFLETQGPGYGAFPLHMAAVTRNQTIVLLLLDNGADIELRAKDSSGGTPLQWAAYVGDGDMVELLVEAGADVNTLDNNGYTAIDSVVVSPDADFEARRRITTFLRANGGKTGVGTLVHMPRAAPPGLEITAEWPAPNYDNSSSRATTESSINSGNVHQLTEAWRYLLPLSPGSGAAATTPIVADETVYLGDLNTNVHAIDLVTGERRWLAPSDAPVFGPSGVAVDDGKVFANKAGWGIAGYDAETGKELWATPILMNGGAVNIQPTVADGKVLAATSSLSQPGARGTLYALDQQTGDILWSFNTIESEDVWGRPDINSGGGAWYPPSIDLDRRVSYWGISNPYPFPGAAGFPNGSSRPGDNKWTDSILAIDLDSGELRWGHQAIPHDIFDRDAVITALVELDDGREVVISTGKMGRVIGLDDDGNVLWDIPVGMHKNDHLTSFEGSIEVLPGAAGGVVTPIAAADGAVYLSVVNAPITYSSPEESSPGAGARLGSFNSQLVAIDAATGEIIWDVQLPGDSFGGATVVNDLVFTSVLSGRILAYKRETGELVWSHQAPGGINAWPAIVGPMLLMPVGFGNPPMLLALELPGGG